MKPYYSKDNITIYQGDCLTVLDELADFDLIFTSPPYNKGIRFNGRWKGKPTISSKGSRFRNGYGVYDDALSMEQYEEWQSYVLTALADHLTLRGALYYNHKPRIINGRLWTPLEIMSPSAVDLRQIVIWNTGAGINIMPGAYVPAHEWILMYVKSGFRLASRGDSALSDVWTIRPTRTNGHPAPFPVELPLKAMRTTKPTCVLDPFMGIGTTLVAAKQLGIPAIGIEIEEKYCQAAVERLEE